MLLWSRGNCKTIEKGFSLLTSFLNKSNRFLEWWKYEELEPQTNMYALHKHTHILYERRGKIVAVVTTGNFNREIPGKNTQERKQWEESHRNHSSWTFCEVSTWHAQMQRRIFEHLRLVAIRLGSVAITHFQYDDHSSWWIYYVNNSHAKSRFMKTSIQTLV